MAYPGAFTVEVRMLSGDRLTALNVDRYWTGWEVQAALRKHLEDGQAVQRLLIGNDLIGKSQTLGDIGLQDGDVLQVLVGKEQGQRQKDGKYQRIRVLAEHPPPFRDVFFLMRNTETHEDCAARQLNVVGLDREERNQIVKEMIAWTQLRHPNLVRIEEVFRTKKSNLFMVMEYVNDGSLKDSLQRSGGLPFSISKVLSYLAQICLALDHIHEKQIIHGSLITRHVFLTHAGQVKLGGLHIPRSLPLHERENPDAIEFGKGRVCPEVLDVSPYTLQSDLWALGVILYETATLTPPFVADSLERSLLLVRQARFTVPTRLHGSDVQPLIEQLLQIDPVLRPCARSLLARPCVKMAAIEVNRRYGLGLDLASLEASTPTSVTSSSIPKLPSLQKTGLEIPRASAKHPERQERPQVFPGLPSIQR